MLMNKCNMQIASMTGSGRTHIFRSNVGFTISGLGKGSIDVGSLSGMQEQILEEFGDVSFVEAVSVYIIPYLIYGSWFAHIIDLESGEIHVIDTKPEMSKKVSREYTEHVWTCMGTALDHFDRQLVVRRGVLQEVQKLVMSEAPMVCSHNRCDSGVLMVQYFEWYNDYSIWTSVCTEDTNLYRVHVIANMLLSPYNDKKVRTTRSFSGYMFFHTDKADDEGCCIYFLSVATVEGVTYRVFL